MKKLEARNLTAQLQYRGRGNPPAVHPDQSVANCYPGLEFDLRNIWKKIFVGIELHENRNVVMKTTSDATRQLGLVNAILHSVTLPHGRSLDIGPSESGIAAFDRPNVFADLVNLGTAEVECEFVRRPEEPPAISVSSLLPADVSREMFGYNNSWAGRFADDDDNAEHPWISDITEEDREETVTFDFKEEYSIATIYVSPGRNEGLRGSRLVPPNLFSDDFFIEVSQNGADWEMVADIKQDVPHPIHILPNRFSKIILTNTISARYARLTVRSKTQIGDSFIAAIGEIRFRSEPVSIPLRVRDIFHVRHGLVINDEALAPGEFTQSLCAPWMYDFRDCWCTYWAASRPDMVNIDEDGNGHNWMDTDRPTSADGKPDYRVERESPDQEQIPSEKQITHTRAITSWESKDVFKFQIGGKDEK